MSACTFFGHHDCSTTVKEQLQNVLIDLIESHGIDLFYVGNHGVFDSIVRSVLRELKQKYPHIQYAVVLAYMPQKQRQFDMLDDSETMLPEGIETVPKRFAISWRNKWMLSRSNFVVTYITHSWGGASKFAELAKRQKKAVFNLAASTESCG